MRKIFVSLMVITFVACNEKENVVPEESMGTWKQLNNFPGEGRGGAISFSLLGKGFYGLGANLTGHLNDMWAYNPDTDAWERKNDCPFYPGEVAVVINDKAYVMTYSGAVYEYDPVLDSWEYRSTFPEGNRPGITGFAIKGKAYFGTGNNATSGDDFKVFKDFWKYDPEQSDWTQLDDFPGVARTEACSFVIGEKGYVGLGYNGMAAPPILKDIWSFDADTGTWKQISDFPGFEALVGISFSGKGKAYIGGPENDDSHKGRVYEYDPVTNNWRSIRKFPSSNSLLTESFVINNRIFVVGGWWSEYANEVWEFIP